jgi:hypothetical protein
MGDSEHVQHGDGAATGGDMESNDRECAQDDAQTQNIVNSTAENQLPTSFTANPKIGAMTQRKKNVFQTDAAGTAGRMYRYFTCQKFNSIFHFLQHTKITMKVVRNTAQKSTVIRAIRRICVRLSGVATAAWVRRASCAACRPEA